MRLVKRSNSKNWYVEIQIDGKHYARSTKTSNKQAAKLLINDIVLAIHKSRTEKPSKDITLVEAIERYMSLRKGSPSEHGLNGVRTSVLKFFDPDILLSNFDGKNVIDFIEHRQKQGRAPQTIKHGVTFINAVIKQAKKEGFNTQSFESPSIAVKPTRLRYLSVLEEQRLLKELDPDRTGFGIPPKNKRPSHILKELQDNYDLVVMLLDTGARYGEITKLKWEHINLKTQTINLWRPKVSNESVLYMTKRVYQILINRDHSRKHIGSNNPFVFTNRSGGHRNGNTIAIRKAFKRAGLTDVTIHTLRHTHATRLIQNGLSIYEVRSVLGHTDIKTTMRYAHLENTSVTKKARDLIEGLGSINHI